MSNMAQFQVLLRGEHFLLNREGKDGWYGFLKTVYVQSDVCNNVAVFAPNPDWHGSFDQDGAKAAATRRRVYDMLAADKLPVQAFHFPFPALARIEKAGDGYRAVPINSV